MDWRQVQALLIIVLYVALAAVLVYCLCRSVDVDPADFEDDDFLKGIDDD